jgi:tetratricopeptide (TPR) repeat protein
MMVRGQKDFGEGKKMRRHCFAVAASTLASVLFAPHVALSQTSEQIDWCNGKDNAAADLQIGGCTAVIQSGKFSGKQLSIAFRLRGDAYGKKPEQGAALKDYDQAIRLDPENVLALINRSSIYQSQKKHDLALADLKKALAVDPKNATAWAYQGDNYYYAGKEQDAINSFAQAIKYAPDWMWPYNDRGELYADRNQFDLALKDFDDVVRVSPTYAMGWNNRCRIRMILNRLEEALSDCEQALKISPTFVNHMVKSGNVTPIQHRGMIHLKAGRFAPAIADLNQALELTKDSAEVLYSRGLAKTKSGDKAGGDADIAAAKKINAAIADKMAKYGVK